MYKDLKTNVDILNHISNEEELKKQLIKIYSLILGYYSYFIDNDINKDKYINSVYNIDKRLQKILNIDYDITTTKNSIMESIFYSVNELCKIDNRRLLTYLTIILESFLKEYDYQTEYYKKNSILNKFFNKKNEEKILSLKLYVDNLY